MVSTFDWIGAVFILLCMLVIVLGLTSVPFTNDPLEKNESEPEQYWDAIGVKVPDPTKWHTRKKIVTITQRETVEVPRTEQLMELLFRRLEPWRQQLLAEGLTLGNLLLYEENDIPTGDVKVTAEVWCIKLSEGQAVDVVKGKNDGIDPFWRLR
jgi:hypothetical protein